jgi:hypothetical protein
MSDSDLTLMEIFFKEEESLRVKLGLAESSETFSALKNKLKEGKWTPFRDFIGLAAKNAKELMDVRVETILVSAWAKYFSLRKYLDKEKYPANSTVTVSIGEHVVKSEHHPYLQVLMGRFESRINFGITVALTLKGVNLVIRDGRIRAIKTGECSAKGTVTCENVPIVEKKSQPVSLPGTIEFENGIPIG